jgi:hypothetical protein
VCVCGGGQLEQVGVRATVGLGVGDGVGTGVGNAAFSRLDAEE